MASPLPKCINFGAIFRLYFESWLFFCQKHICFFQKFQTMKNHLPKGKPFLSILLYMCWTISLPPPKFLQVPRSTLKKSIWRTIENPKTIYLLNGKTNDDKQNESFIASHLYYDNMKWILQTLWMLSPRNTNCFWSILDNPTFNDFLLWQNNSNSIFRRSGSGLHTSTGLKVGSIPKLPF